MDSMISAQLYEEAQRFGKVTQLLRKSEQALIPLFYHPNILI